MKTIFGKEDAAQFRMICLERINEIDNERNACLALSGGTDSMTILFSMLETGRKPECYTFYMQGYESRDLQSSRHACKYFGLKLNEIVIPSSIDAIYNDIRRVIPFCEYPKKTIIQCMIPWLYIYAAMDCEKIINGIAGDDHYATEKNMMIAYAKGGEKAVLKHRRLFDKDLNYSEANIVRLASHFGKKNEDFYATEKMEKFLLGYTYRAINYPYAKKPSIMAFADYYKAEPFYRDLTEHCYQINSHLKNYHNALLQSKYNRRGAKDVVAIYNDIWRELKHEQD